MSPEYEAERAVSREDAATALRQLADGVAAGSVSVGAEAGPVAVDVPADLTFEVELEEGDDEVELEVELEWDAAETDGAAIRELDPDAESVSDQDEPAADAVGTTTEQDGSATGLVEPATDPAAPTDDSGSKARFELFQDAADEWRWRLRHRNGNIIADGGEGYDRKAGAINGLESVKSNAPHAVVEEASDE